MAKNIQRYIESQLSTIEKTRKKTEIARINKNIAMAVSIENQVISTKSNSDLHLRMLNNSRYGQGSKTWENDPVIEKLNYIREELLKEIPLDFLFSPSYRIPHRIQNYFLSIADRKMNEEIYLDLLETPERELLDRWVTEDEKKYGSERVA